MALSPTRLCSMRLVGGKAGQGVTPRPGHGQEAEGERGSRTQGATEACLQHVVAGLMAPALPSKVVS